MQATVSVFCHAQSHAVFTVMTDLCGTATASYRQFA